MRNFTIAGLLKKGTFKIRMTVGLSVIVLFTSFIISYFSYRTYSGPFQSELSEQFAIANEQTLARIEFKIADLYRMSNSIMFNPQVESLIKSLSKGQPELDKYEMQSQLSHTLSQIKYDYTQVRSLYLLDLNGVNRYYGHMQNYVKEMEPSIFGKLQADLEANKGEPIWMMVDNSMLAEPQTELWLVRVMQNNSLETYGIMVMVLDASFFRSLFDDQVNNSDRRTYLLDNRHRLLYPYIVDAGDDSAEFVRMNDTDEGPIRRNAYLVAKNSSDNVKFSLVSRISLADMNRIYNRILRRSLMIGGIGIVISVLFVLLLSRRLLHPLGLLVQAMRRLRQGELDTRIHIRTHDELSFIGQGFNDMASHINSLIQEVYIRQISEREAELKAYQAQFNPHFLHNTLNGLYWKLYMDNNKDSARLVSSLSELLKYSLEPAGIRTTLHEEMGQIRNYLDIQRAFMEEELESVILVSDDVRECEVFRLLLQPLVENIFVHAFRNHTGPKVLIIRGFRKDDLLNIEITDNGCGMSEDVMASLMRADHSDKKPRERLGVLLVHRRIDLLYGTPYGIRYSSETGRGTTVQIALPLILAESKQEG